MRPGNPYPYNTETVVVRRDSSGVPPRELDFCNYSDSIDTVLAYGEDSLLISFLPGEHAQGWIKAIFSLKEGFLYYYGSGFDSSDYMAARVDEEGIRKKDFAMSYQDRMAGIIRVVKPIRKAKLGGLPGFTFGNSRFDAVGRCILSVKPE